MKDRLVQKRNGTPYKVLIAEDKEINQIMAVNLFKSLGCVVTLVKDGEQALKKVRESSFDIIFMDCQMPIVDGYEATRQIRLFEESVAVADPVPIIALTARVMLGDKEKCIECGMDDYITKPIRKDSVCNMINTWCARVISYESQW